MRFSTIIIALALAASSTFAGLFPTAENTDPVARALPECEPSLGSVKGNTGINRPKAHATIYTGKKFLFSFCSPTYYKESSNQILVGFEMPGKDTNYTRLVGDGTYPAPKGYSPEVYTQHLTVSSDQVSEGAVQFVVYEFVNGYTSGLNFVKYTQPVNVKYSPKSNDSH